MEIEADVAIIGGGIVGVSTALALQRRGLKTVVLERWMIGAEASSRNAGGVRQEGRLLPEIPLARGAVRLWERLDEMLGRPTGYRQVGHMYLASTDGELRMLAEMRERELAVGLESEMLDEAGVRELAPGVGSGFIGAKFCPTDGCASPSEATVAIADAAREAGAEIFCHQPVQTISVREGRVDHVVSPGVRVSAPVVIAACGPWTPYVAQLVEVYVPIYPSRAHIVRTRPLPPLATPFVQTAAMDFAFCQLPDGTARVGGGATPDDVTRFTYGRRFEHERQERILRKARSVFPYLEGVEIEARWAGVRECTPDMMPILGPVGGPDGFMVAAGFSGHGFCLGPYVGELMAEWVQEGAPSVDLNAFSFRRFHRPEGPLSVVEAKKEQTG